MDTFRKEKQKQKLRESAVYNVYEGVEWMVWVKYLDASLKAYLLILSLIFEFVFCIICLPFIPLQKAESPDLAVLITRQSRPVLKGRKQSTLTVLVPLSMNQNW